MNPAIAAAVYLTAILGLCFLEAAGSPKTSKALWLPLLWLFINGSRSISAWLSMTPPTSADTDGSPLDRAIFSLLILGAVIALWQRGKTVAQFLRANPALLVFVLYCLVSILWSDYPEVAFKRWIKSIGDVMMVLIVLTDRQRSAAIKLVLGRVGCILMPLSILLIKYFPDMARSYSPWDGRMFVSGVATDKNMLGMTCLVFGLGAVWLLFEDWRDAPGRPRSKRLFAHSLTVAMMLWLFWSADSKTALACFLMAGGLLALTRLGRFARRPAMVSVLVATVVFTSFSVLFLHVGSSALETMGRNSTLTGRTDIWQGLLTVQENALVGSGFESFWVGEHLNKIWFVNSYLYGINEAHDGYLEIYLNLGWIGVILLTVLLFTGYRNIMSTFRQDPRLGSLAVAFFVAAIVYAFTESAFRMMCPVWIALLLAMMAVPKAVPARARSTAMEAAWPFAPGGLDDVTTPEPLVEAPTFYLSNDES
jgi:exopolysaccharide production protein ExoQ